MDEATQQKNLGRIAPRCEAPAKVRGASAAG